MKNLIICTLALFWGITTLSAQPGFPCGTTITTSLIGEFSVPAHLTSIIITAEGGDGGGARRDVGLCDRRAEGGAGAGIAAEFEIGLQPDQLQPGGTIKTIVGQPGGEGSRVCSNTVEGPAGGGGGSTAVLYLPPNEDPEGPKWRILMVAGGGGGASRWDGGDFYGGGGGLADLNNPGDGGCGAYREDGGDENCSYPGAGYLCNSVFYSEGGCDPSGAGRSFVNNLYTSDPIQIQLRPNSQILLTGGQDVENSGGGDAAGGSGFTGGGGSNYEWGGGGGGFTGGEATENTANDPEPGPGSGGTSYLTSEFQNTLIVANAGYTGGGTGSSGYVQFVTPDITNIVCKTSLTVSLDSDGEALLTADQLDDGSTLSCGERLSFFNGSSPFSAHLFTCVNIGNPLPISLSVLDQNDNETASCYVPVTIVDNTPPNARCRNAMVQLDATGNGTTTVSAINKGSDDNCGIATRVLDNDAFDCNDIGSGNIVTLIVTDHYDNTSTCTANVTVQENTDVTAICQDATVQLDANGNGSATPDAVDNGSSDVCGIADRSLDNANFNCNDIGTGHTVTLTVTDNSGATSTCTATVTVEDNVGPNATCKNTTVVLNSAGSYTLSQSDVFIGATDNCGTATFQNVVPSVIDCSTIGNPVSAIVTVEDTNGNTSTCTSTVTYSLLNNCPAGDRTWTGAASTDWNEPCNWNPTCVPTANDDVIIPPTSNAPLISSSTAALAKSVHILTGAVLTVEASGSLTINNASGDGLIATGTVSNAGEINIDNTGADGIGFGFGGHFSNTGTINIGQNGGNITNDGIGGADGTFEHLAGVINIDNVGNDGIETLGVPFTNYATINIGQNAGNINEWGLYVRDLFINTSTGVINIGNTNNTGMFVRRPVENEGTINIGQNGKYVAGDGLSLYHTFLNQGNGTINIDNTQLSGISIGIGSLTNAAIINIGLNGGPNNIGSDGIRVGNFLNNNAGGIITIANAEDNAILIQEIFNNNACAITKIQGTITGSFYFFQNEGLFSIDSPNPSVLNYSTFRNNGLVEDIQGSLPINDPGFINNEIVIAPSTGDCNTVDPAFVLGNPVDFNILGIYIDPSATTSAGTYDVNTNIFTPSIALGQYTLFVEVEDSNNGCTRIVSWAVNLEDVVPPSIVCPADRVIDAPDNICETTVTLIPPVVMEECVLAMVRYHIRKVDASGNELPDFDWSDWFTAAQLDITLDLGYWKVQWQAVDASNNQEVCSSIVQVREMVPPVVSCQDLTITFNGESTLYLDSDALWDESASYDDCGDVFFISSSIDMVSCDQLGSTIPVSVTLEDSNGNEARCTANVSIDGLLCGWSVDPTGIGCNPGEADYDLDLNFFQLSSEGCYDPAYYRTNDQLGFIQTQLCGDGEIIAEVTDIIGNGWAGISMRENNSPSARMIQLMINGQGLTRREVRTTAGSPAFAHTFQTVGRNWLRISRNGDQFSAYHSTDGSNWEVVFILTIPIGSCLDAGLITMNGSATGEVTATFEHVMIMDGSVAPLTSAPTNILSETSLESSLNPTLQIAPNPMSSHGTVTISIPEANSVKITILDLQGRVVNRLHNGYLDAGTHTRHWDGTNQDGSALPAGLYFIQLQSGDELVTKKVLLQQL